MKITNKYNLPEALVKAVQSRFDNAVYPDNRIGVTTLIDSPYRRMLTTKYSDEIEEDVANMLWAILGIAVHKVLEQFDRTVVRELKVEHKYMYKGVEYTIVCVGDLWVPAEKKLTDWKITSKYSMDKDKDEWISQLNVNKYLFESIGLKIEALEISAILRDFSKKDKLENKFPFEIPFVARDIPVFDKETIEEYINDRLQKHFVDEIKVCSPTERWEKPAAWAIMKKEAKRATKLYYTKEEAEQHLSTLGTDYYIQFRKGEDVRCHDYCSVNKFCEYYKTTYLNKDIPSLRKGNDE